MRRIFWTDLRDKVIYYFVTVGLFAALLLSVKTASIQGYVEESRDAQVKADDVIRTTYLGQPIPFTELSAGYYTVECVVDEHLGYAVVRETIPTGDITRLVGELPNGYCSSGVHLDLRYTRST